MSASLLEVSRARPVLGTLVQIQASGPADSIHGAIDSAFAAIEHIHSLLSYQQADSELAALNRQPCHALTRVHADTYAVLSAALHFAQLSEGAFDPCVGWELEQWGLLPMAGKRPAGRAIGSWRDIELLPDHYVCIHKPVRVDLGGIAKGYAVDAAVRTLIDSGMRDILVNAGGDLRVHGPCARRIALRHPLAPERTGESIALRDAALASSAAYYSRQHNGPRAVSALVNPAGRRPHLDPSSVSVQAPNCLSADALTKVVLFAPAAVAERALSACDAIAYIQQPELIAAQQRSSSSARGLAVYAP